MFLTCCFSNQKKVPLSAVGFATYCVQICSLKGSMFYTSLSVSFIVMGSQLKQYIDLSHEKSVIQNLNSNQLIHKEYTYIPVNNVIIFFY